MIITVLSTTQSSKRRASIRYTLTNFPRFVPEWHLDSITPCKTTLDRCFDDPRSIPHKL